MAYIQKYKYQSLSRENVDGRRLYSTPSGALPSVTTILDATKTEESKAALRNWRNRIGHEKAQQITTEAANRGTRMHSYLEHYIKDGTMRDRGTNPYSWPSHEMAKVVIENGLVHCQEFWGLEAALYFPQIYAGTTDCVGIHRGVPAIIDFKQSNREKKREWIEDYFLQLAAYSSAHNELHGTSINKGVIMMAVKPELDKDGLMIGTPKYLEFVVEGAEFAHWIDKWWRRVEEYYTKFM